MLETYIAFIGASFIIILTPGPDILFAITQGISFGKKAGLKTALGLSLGNLFHILLCIFGIGLLIKTNIYAFSLLKYLGALYLFYLSYMSFKVREQNLFIDKLSKKESNLYLKGFIMNVLNPKVSIFFIAFFPQFINKDMPNQELQIFILGMVFVVLVFMIFGLLSWFAGSIRVLVQNNKRISYYLNTSSSLLFFLIGLRVIFI